MYLEIPVAVGFKNVAIVSYPFYFVPWVFLLSWVLLLRLIYLISDTVSRSSKPQSTAVNPFGSVCVLGTVLIHVYGDVLVRNIGTRFPSII